MRRLVTPPTDQEFLTLIKFSKKKAAEPDGVPPHLLQHLPEEHLRVLFKDIAAIRHGAPCPTNGWSPERS